VIKFVQSPNQALFFFSFTRQPLLSSCQPVTNAGSGSKETSPHQQKNPRMEQPTKQGGQILSEEVKSEKKQINLAWPLRKPGAKEASDQTRRHFDEFQQTLTQTEATVRKKTHFFFFLSFNSNDQQGLSFYQKTNKPNDQKDAAFVQMEK
jgi:hypothetical protein